MNDLQKLLPETMEALDAQLESDQKVWGETWRQRPTEGQEDRIFYMFKKYKDQFDNAGVPIPWLKILGLAHIALVRQNHPELLEEEE